jgi:1-aminocyclopropane-1-carboxylate deaminase/D-cysteine desulfhydrase-like pyridoxal-dependent ACC family enzyme
VFDAIAALPTIPLGLEPTPVEELTRLRSLLAAGPRLLVKRDDAIPFAFGGNKVRKLRLVAADALAQRADTLITCGGVQSNHARVTAAVAAKLGLRCVLVVNGAEPSTPTANALLDRLLGAEIRHVGSRTERTAMMETVAGEERAAGRRPYMIPLGASIPLGAAALALAIHELSAQMAAPDVILHSSSSAGTQAGFIAGCALAGLRSRVIGISADESAASLAAEVRRLLDGLASTIGTPGRFDDVDVEIDDGFVGGGYGVPTRESQEAIELLARTEALFLDPTYTAKAMAALISYVRSGKFAKEETVLFWHTGGQVGLFR